MQEPKCQCGKPKSSHNILSLAAHARGAVKNGPYVDMQGQVFCESYREATR